MENEKIKKLFTRERPLAEQDDKKWTSEMASPDEDMAEPFLFPTIYT